MAFAHGKKAVFKLDDSGGTLRTLTSYLTSAGLARDVDTAETSTLGTDDKQFLNGLRGASIPLEGNFDATIDGYLAGLLGGDPTDWEYYPQGEGSGKVKYSGQAILNSYESNSDIGDAGKISAELTVNGAVTRAIV